MFIFLFLSGRAITKRFTAEAVNICYVYALIMAWNQMVLTRMILQYEQIYNWCIPLYQIGVIQKKCKHKTFNSKGGNADRIFGCTGFVTPSDKVAIRNIFLIFLSPTTGVMVVIGTKFGDVFGGIVNQILFSGNGKQNSWYWEV